MKQYFLFFIIFLICTTCMQQYCLYQNIIVQNASLWKNNNIETLSNPDHLQTIIDIILLSYQLAEESCSMVIAKLEIEEEILKIYTPSLIDSWQTNLQVLQNDTYKLEQALERIKASQLKIKQIFETIKLITSRFIQIHPQATQTLIANLKDGLVLWAKEQCKIEPEINSIQQEFSIAISTINDLKNLFTITIPDPEFKNNQLKHAVGCVSKSYKDIETVFGHFTNLRKKTTYEMSQFFRYFFKTYYNIVYSITKENKFTDIKTIAYNQDTLPCPQSIFSISTTINLATI